MARKTTFADGVVIQGDFSSKSVREEIGAHGPKFPLILLDPPYNGIVNETWDKAMPQGACADWFLSLASESASFAEEQGALYFFGGYGTPENRPFFEFLAKVEAATPWSLANFITWAKKRGYGVQNNYLSIREECAYFILGDPKKPRCFNVPLLKTKRGYPGYNKRYPARSEFLRRTSVWTDITEVLRGKTHPTEKPVELYSVPIEVHTEPGETILDPMAGSGVAAVAARALGRRFVLVERDADYYSNICKRLGQRTRRA